MPQNEFSHFWTVLTWSPKGNQPCGSLRAFNGGCLLRCEVHLNPCLMNQPPSSQPTGPALRGMCFVFSGTFLSHEKSLISDVLYSLPDCVGAMVSSCLVCPIQVGNSDQPSPPRCGRPSTPGNPAPDRLKAQSTAKNSAFETKSSQATNLSWGISCRVRQPSRQNTWKLPTGPAAWRPE